MEVAAVAAGHGRVGEGQAETLRQQGRQRVLVAGDAEPVDVAGAGHDPVALAAEAVADAQAFALEGGVPKAAPVGGEAVAADTGQIGEHVAADEVAAMVDEITDLGAKTEDFLEVCHGRALRAADARG